jgi:electron transfer flavoprotein alpha subunit
MGTILAFIEHRDDTILAGSLQALGVAQNLAAGLDAPLHAVMIGARLTGLAERLHGCGVSVLHLVESPALSGYTARAHTAALHAAVTASGARTIIMGTTATTRDLAPRLGVRLGAAVATDCIAVSVADSTIRVRRPQFAGNLVADLELPAGGVRIITIRPNTFPTPARSPGGSQAEVRPLTPDLSGAEHAVTPVELIRTTGSVKDVAEADVIVAGGRSLKSAENFRLLEDLAASLDAAVGASRAAVDAGYQPHSRQIGLTGKVVTPNLYIACGIDGAIQHLAGMRGSKTIVAINTNKDAPIFQVATYGCVADLFTLVPLLTAEIKRLKNHT